MYWHLGEQGHHIKRYRKKTHTDRYLDFTSHHPLAHKVAVARTLMTRADRICTFVPDRDKEKQHIVEALNNNGYPSQHVNKNWWPRSSPRSSSSEDPPKSTVVIPYIRHLSESIRRILTPPEGSHLLSATPHPQADASESQRPHPPKPTGRSGLQNPMWQLREGLHWPNRQNTRP